MPFDSINEGSKCVRPWYVLDSRAVGALLDAKPHMHSLQLDVIPALVRRQFRAPIKGESQHGGNRFGGLSSPGGGGGGVGAAGGEAAGAEGDDADDGLMDAVFGAAGRDGLGGVKSGGAARPCCVYLAGMLLRTSTPIHPDHPPSTHPSPQTSTPIHPNYPTSTHQSAQQYTAVVHHGLHVRHMGC
jgi:hypothetical protein